MIYSKENILNGPIQAKSDIDCMISNITDKLIQCSISHKVIAYLLGGGFGRGEGSVIFENGKYRTSNDYDIFAICFDDIDIAEIDKEAKRIEEDLELSFFGIDVIKISFLYEIINKKEISQSYYDFLYGTQILWVNSDANGINVYKIFDEVSQTKQSKNISLRSAFDVLKTRLWCIIALSDYVNGDTYDKEYCKNYNFFHYQQVKACTAIIDAICISENNYISPKFEDKLNCFNKSKFSQIYDTSLIVDLVREKINNSLSTTIQKAEKDTIEYIYLNCIEYLINNTKSYYIKYCLIGKIKYSLGLNSAKSDAWSLNYYKILRDNKKSKIVSLQKKMRGIYK